MNRWEAFKNLAASIVEKSSFRIDLADAGVSAASMEGADCAGNAEKAGASAGGHESSAKAARTGTASTAIRNWSR